MSQKRWSCKRSLSGTGDQYKCDTISNGSSVYLHSIGPTLLTDISKFGSPANTEGNAMGISRVKSSHPKRGTWAPVLVPSANSVLDLQQEIGACSPSGNTDDDSSHKLWDHQVEEMKG